MRQDKTSSPLVFFPSRRRMLLQLAGILAGVGVGGILIWLAHSSISGWQQVLLVFAIILLVGALGFWGGTLMYRIVRPSPAIIVREDGIVDNASFIYSGVGFIPWAQIAAVGVRNYATAPISVWSRKFLIIIPVNAQEFEYALPKSVRLQRLVTRWNLWSSPMGIFIPQFMLPSDAKFVRLDISTAYYQWYPRADASILFD